MHVGQLTLTCNGKSIICVSLNDLIGDPSIGACIVVGCGHINADKVSVFNNAVLSQRHVEYWAVVIDISNCNSEQIKSVGYAVQHVRLFYPCYFIYVHCTCTMASMTCDEGLHNYLKVVILRGAYALV